eukprot:SAG22_NODE_5457_length_1010_cov_1.060373_2_plen_99_part_00
MAAFQLPIVAAAAAADSADLAAAARTGLQSAEVEAELARLAAAIERATANTAPVSLPQLRWNERPSWPDKLFFATSRGAARRRKRDTEFEVRAIGRYG